MTMQIQKTIPIFRMFDVAKAKEFYIGFLGFSFDWEHRFNDNAPVFMQVSRAGLTLHLSEHHGDCCPGSTVSVWMTGIDEFHKEISSKNYKYYHASIETTFYNARCMTVTDPFGNHIRFHEEIKKAEG